MKTLCILFVFVVLFLLAGCSQNQEPAVVMRVAVFLSNTNHYTYLFDLDADGVLQVFYGERKSNSIEKSDFMRRIEEKAEKQLTPDEIKTINQLSDTINDTEDFDLGDSLVFDTVEAIIFTNNHKYHFIYPSEVRREHEDFVDAIIQLSPMQVDFQWYGGYGRLPIR